MVLRDRRSICVTNQFKLALAIRVTATAFVYNRNDGARFNIGRAIKDKDGVIRRRIVITIYRCTLSLLCLIVR